MDYTNPDFLLALGIGGTAIGVLSLLFQVMSKNHEEPYSGIRYRAVFRDFFFGAFITSLLYMFMPESVLNVVSASQETLSKLSGGSPFASSTPDLEIQTGPARF
jgi:hypothetical protein